MTTMNRYTYMVALLVYIKLWVFDMIDYYLIYLALSLPSHMFGSPVLHIKQIALTDDTDSSDDDDSSSLIEYNVYISKLLFIFKTRDAMPLMEHRVLNGAQLRLLVNENGRFFLPRINQYYPLLDTIVIDYTKFEPTDSNIDELPVQTKILDVKKRYDIRNGISCKMGVVF